MENSYGNSGRWASQRQSWISWKSEYWDDHPTRVVIKVDSHQLHEDLTKNKRYDEITPNFCLVSMNQIADNAASLGMNTLRKVPVARFPTPPIPDNDRNEGL
jgi:hypothetical protein